MAIVLQDTTISGLAAGGLPTGTVTSATLADASVTAAKLGYTGNVIQCLLYSDSSYASASGTGVVLNAVSGTITPQFSNSKILVLYTVVVGSSGSGANSQPYWTWVTRNDIEIGLGTTGGPGRPAIASNNNASSYSAGDCHLSTNAHIIDSPASTSVLTYIVKIGMRRDSSYGVRLNMPWNYSTYNQQWQAPGICTMMLMELKQ